MNKTNSILPLITKWEEFTEINNEVNLESFAVWILNQKSISKFDIKANVHNTQYLPKGLYDKHLHDIMNLGINNVNNDDNISNIENNNQDEVTEHHFMDLNGNFIFNQDYPKIPDSKGFTIFLISRLFKSIKFYFKDILAKHNLSNLDDFTILATVLWKGQSTKKELCIYNMIDISTGMEIIRRLAKIGYLNEIQNSEDKREKLISITNLGISTLFSIFEESNNIPDVMSDLDNETRINLIHTLEKLNHFHTQIYKYSIDNK